MTARGSMRTALALAGPVALLVFLAVLVRLVVRIGPVQDPAPPPDVLALDLTASDTVERTLAFERLSADARPSAFRLVVELLHHEPDADLRARVRAWVVSRPFQQVGPVADALVAGDHPEARAWLAAALAGGEDERAARLGRLARLATDADARVRWQAAAGICRLEAAAGLGPDRAAGEELVALARSRDPVVRAWAAETLGRCVPHEDDWRVLAAGTVLMAPLPDDARPTAVFAGRYDVLPAPYLSAAARWLVRHQDLDGSWDGSFHNPLGTGGLPGFTHEMAYARPALAGLGLLALLHAGAYPEAGRIGVAAAHAAEYLLAHQAEDGRVGVFDDEARAIAHAVDPEGKAPPKSLVALFNHAIGTWALVELALTTRNLAHERAASAALHVLAVERHHRHPWSRWFDPTDDVAYAGYAILALLVERAAGERWSDGALTDEAAQYLKHVSRPDGRVYHENVRPHCFGGYDSSATGLFLRGLLPLDLGEAESRARTLLFESSPVWNDRYPIPETIAQFGDDPGPIANLHLWHFGALAAARCDTDERARAWRAALVKMLADHQRVGPWADAGAWDPIDPWGRVGGRVYSTAASMLAWCAPTAYRWGR